MLRPRPITAAAPQRRFRPAAWLLAWLVLVAGSLGVVAPASAAPATIATGEFHGCAITGTGAIACWGQNTSGQLGDGTTQSTSAPVTVVGLDTATAVTAHTNHSCALQADRTVWCWGANGVGQLGDGTTTASSTPVQVAGLDDAIAVSAGRLFTCALRAGGTVRCWGRNNDHQLGADDNAPHATTPLAVAGLSGATAISAGNRSACALRQDRTVICWGYNGTGQLGDGTTTTRSTPTLPVVGLTDATAIATGGSTGHTCAVRATGSVRCWGYNRDGQLGDSTDTTRHEPVDVGGVANATDVRVLSSSSCALGQDGTVSCWGDNWAGQLGSGTAAAFSPHPIPVVGVTGATEISGGWGHACARDDAQAVVCWGYGNEGQLGGGRSALVPSPVAVSALSGVLDLSVGERHACVLRDDRTINCWGVNGNGRLGNGTPDAAPTPTPVTGISDATAISAGRSHGCALRGPNDRRISCWGANTWPIAAGALGNGGGPNSLVPVDVDVTAIQADNTGGSFRAIAAGGSHSCALWGTSSSPNATGAVWCWGDGEEGAVGHGASAIVNTPRATQPAYSYKLSQDEGATLVTAQAHSCAVTTAKGVRCWGKNTVGQLGAGTTSDGEHSPQTVLTNAGQAINGVRMLVAGSRHTCALRSGDEVWCWGSNGSQQLGSAVGQYSARAVRIDPATTGLSGIVALVAGGDQTCAITADGSLRCWGRRTDGPLLGATNPVAPTPGAVAGLTVVSPGGVPGRHAGLGTDHGCAVVAGGTVRCWGDATDGAIGDGAMPTGHYPIQRTPTTVVGFGPELPPGGDPGPGSPGAGDEQPPGGAHGGGPLPHGGEHPGGPGAPPSGVTVPPTPNDASAGTLRRPQPLTVELRDGTLSLRQLTLKRAKKAPTCPKTAKATIVARVGRRTVTTTRTVRLQKTKTGCRTTATVKLKRQAAQATRVTLTITGKGLTRSKRTVKARFSTALTGTTVKLDRLLVRSTRKDVCPTHATVTVAGATKTTSKQRVTRKNVAVRLAPTANCHVTTTIKLPTTLRRATAVSVTVRAAGLTTTKRTVRTR